MDEEAWPSILARTRQGDEGAVHQVLTWLHLGGGKQILLNCLRNIGVPPQSLEDAAADVRLAVLAELAAGKFRGNVCGEFVLYVKKICSTYARRYRTNVKVSATKTTLEFLHSDTAEDPATAAGLRKDLEAALIRLPDRYVEAWNLYDVDGYPFEEIAIFMHCRPTRVRKLVSKARQALGSWLTFLALVVDIYLTPSPPKKGQRVESWLHLWNNGYDDVRGLRVALHVDKQQLGRLSTDVLRHHEATLRGFTLWTRSQGRQTLCVTWALGGKKASKTHTVEDS